MTPVDPPVNADRGGWVKIGSQPVSDGVYYDEIEISEEKKNVKRLKIKALKNAIFISSVKVIYKGNTSESHNINGRLEKGKSSDAFNLIGHYRTIEKILVTYGQTTSSNGKSVAELVVMAKM